MSLAEVQQAGIDFIAERRRVVLGDDPGLGKTRQALMGLDVTDAYPAVVVTPAGHLKMAWAREAARWTPHRTIHVSPGGRPGMLRHDITVIAYTEAHKWGPVLPHGYRGLVLDEAHRIKNASARRSAAVLALAAKAAPEATMIALTGTLAPNGRSGEVVRVLRAIRRIDDLGGTAGVLQATPLDLHRRLSDVCYLRRLKDDTLPPRSWMTIDFDGDPALMRAYRQAEAGVAVCVGDLRAATGEDLAGLAREHRSKLMGLKGILAEAKIRDTVDWVRGFREETGRKVITFADRRRVVSALAEEFAGSRIQGGQSMPDRTAVIDQFQSDPARWGVSCNMAAAGEGITLTAASDVLFVELPWTPGALDQCLDRVHRIGQEHPVIGWVTQVPGTIDEDMWLMLAEKRAGMDAIQDGAGRDGEGWTVEGGVLAGISARHHNRG